MCLDDGEPQLPPELRPPVPLPFPDPPGLERPDTFEDELIKGIRRMPVPTLPSSHVARILREAASEYSTIRLTPHVPLVSRANNDEKDDDLWGWRKAGEELRRNWDAQTLTISSTLYLAIRLTGSRQSYAALNSHAQYYRDYIDEHERLNQLPAPPNRPPSEMSGEEYVAYLQHKAHQFLRFKRYAGIPIGDKGYDDLQYVRSNIRSAALSFQNGKVLPSDLFVVRPQWSRCAEYLPVPPQPVTANEYSRLIERDLPRILAQVREERHTEDPEGLLFNYTGALHDTVLGYQVTGFHTYSKAEFERDHIDHASMRNALTEYVAATNIGLEEIAKGATAVSDELMHVRASLAVLRIELGEQERRLDRTREQIASARAQVGDAGSESERISAKIRTAEVQLQAANRVVARTGAELQRRERDLAASENQLEATELNVARHMETWSGMEVPIPGDREANKLAEEYLSASAKLVTLNGACQAAVQLVSRAQSATAIARSTHYSGLHDRFLAEGAVSDLKAALLQVANLAKLAETYVAVKEEEHRAVSVLHRNEYERLQTLEEQLARIDLV